jgi:recombinational DNA repair protein (RecF pathway)
MNRSEPNSSLVAIFYEQFGKMKESLDIWRSQGSLQDLKLAEAASDETVRILKNVKDKNLIFEYLEWVAKQYPDRLKTFFKGANEQVMNREKTLEWIKKQDKDDKNGLREKYLETMVLENKVIDDTSHTMLALYYVQVLFGIKPQNSRLDDPGFKNDPKYKLWVEYKDKLNVFLNADEARYNAESVIHEIKDSYLFDEEIYLSGKLRNHEKAMEKLLSVKRFAKAEQYCAERNENLLTALFKKYIKRFEDAQSQKDQRMEYLKVISNFLKQYASHPQLDPLEVLDVIPPDFPMKEDSDDNGVYTFLFSAFSSTLHQRRNSKMAKSVSEMDLFNAECNLIKAQGAHVKITKNRKCDVCAVGIGKRAFVVYPNGVVADRQCTSDNFKICPVTKQDFEKSFTG